MLYRFLRAYARRPEDEAMRYLLFALLFFSACSPAYRSFVAADGKTYYAYECSDFGSCMRGIYDQCPERYHVVHLSQVPTSVSPSVVPLAEPGAEALAHGGGRVVFTCARDDTAHQIAAIRRDFVDIAKQIDDRPVRFTDGF